MRDDPTTKAVDPPDTPADVRKSRSRTRSHTFVEEGAGWPLDEASESRGGEGAEGRILHPGDEVDHFRILRMIGRGGMGEVYLARDTQLGRKVAIKVLRPRALGSERAVERFWFEARATARFNFPHIVTIHAVGEFDELPYIAMEYLEGESLQDRLDRTQPSALEATRIALAVAEALQVAHGHKILHRDLKPCNVMLPRDGRLRVVDFGLAKVSSEPVVAAPWGEEATAEASFEIPPARATAARGIRGTPTCMAPEQWSGEPAAGATDVWALGLLLYEMLEDRHPLANLDAVQICARVGDPEPLPPPTGAHPRELVELVQRCLNKEPARRPPVSEVVDSLRDLLRVDRDRAPQGASPFRGLLPLDERHAGQFFGRDDEIAAFVERMREETVLPVVGPSGAGKTSFIQAGVVPRLREQGPWIVLRVRPGERPFHALASKLSSKDASRNTTDPLGGDSVWDRSAAELASEGVGERGLYEELRTSPASLSLRLNRIAEEEGARVLLFVDQLEELYTMVDDPTARRTFMEAVSLAADDAAGPVRVAFTAREDHIGRLALGPASRAALGRATVLVTPGPEALAEILTRPVLEAGHDFDDPDVVEEMVTEVRDESAALPLLQFAGRTLWMRRDRDHKRLLRAVYEEMGGVAGCLAHHADGVLAALSAQQVRVARAMLLRLVTPDGTRRVATREELVRTGTGVGPDAEGVFEQLVAGRILHLRKAFRGGEEGAELELAHEALVQAWDRLAQWVEESRDERAFLTQLEQAAALWSDRGCRDDEAWTGEALEEARRQVRRIANEIPEAGTRFLEAGSRVERADRRRRRIHVAEIVVFVLLVVGGAAYLVHLAADPGRRCAQAERRLSGVWGPGASGRLEAALIASGHPHAQAAADRATTVLDEYAGQWAAEYTEACEDTHVRGEQSELAFDRRMGCLDRRRGELGALIDVLSGDLGRDEVENAPRAAYELTPPAVCADVEALMTAVPPPEDPGMRARVDATLGDLDRAAALDHTGLYSQGLEVALAAEAEADAIGFAPLRAESLYRLGVLQQNNGQPEAAAETLLESARVAAVARDDELIAAAAVRQVRVIGGDLDRYEDAMAMGRSADVAVVRAGDAPQTRAQLLNDLGIVLRLQGKLDAALEHFDRSLDLRRQALGDDHPLVGDSHNNLGNTLADLGRGDEALEAYNAALQTYERTLGGDHPSVAVALINLSVVGSETGNFEAAWSAFDRARTIYESTYEPDGTQMNDLRFVRASLLDHEGRYEEALRQYETILGDARRLYGEDHLEVVLVVNNIGEIHQAMGQYGEACAHYRAALETLSTTQGAHSLYVATFLYNLAEAQRLDGRCGAAQQDYQRALRVLERAEVTDNPLVAEIRSGLAACGR